MVDSDPAATYTSPSPRLIAWKAILIVWSEEAQKRLTVVAGTLAGMPPSSEAGSCQVVTLLVMGEATTHHHIDHRGPIHLRDLFHEGVDGRSREIISPDLDE